MSFYSRFICAHAHTVRIFEFAYRRILHIDRNVDQDRTFSAGICNIKCFFKNLRNVLCIFDQIAVFDKGFRRSSDIRLLEHIAADQLAVDLSGNAHKRNAVCKSRCDASNQVCRTGTARYRAYAHLAGHTSQTAGCMRRILLRSDQDRFDIRIQQTVIKRTDRNPRISKYHFYAFIFKAFYHCLSTIHAASPPRRHPVSVLCDLSHLCIFSLILSSKTIVLPFKHPEKLR